MDAKSTRPSGFRKRALARVAAILLAIALVVALWRSRVGHVPFGGTHVQIPLRVGSLRTSVSEGRATFVVPGSADIRPMIESGAPQLGLRLLDQAGALYTLQSLRDDGLHVVLVTEKLRGPFVEIRCSVQRTPITPVP